MRRVSVHQPKHFASATVARLISDRVLPTRPDDEVAGPFLTVDGRIHRPTSDYLRSLAAARPDSGTATRYASELAAWIDFLCNVRDYHPFEDHRDPVFLATEDDFAAYWRRRQYGDDEHRMTSEGWKNARKAIKRFYEHAERAYYHRPPFNITTFKTREGGSGTTIAGYAPRRRHTSSAGTPLTPAWAEQLLMGALRVDLDGRQAAYSGAERDHALVSLCLATGMRRNNLVNITTYEIPPLTDLPLTTTQVADLITKNSAGGDALTFTHRLRAVHDYLAGPRRDEVATRPYRPTHPLHLVDADRQGFRYRDPSANDPEVVRHRSWMEADAVMRRRLVDQTAATPLLFCTPTGRPLSYSGMQHVVAGAARFVRAQINPDFPERFRLHDLRHTYAVHLTVAIYRQVLTDALRHNAEPSDTWVVDHITQAVELAKFSLGHASEDSTKLYVQAAHRFLGIPLEHFLGGA